MATKNIQPSGRGMEAPRPEKLGQPLELGDFRGEPVKRFAGPSGAEVVVIGDLPQEMGDGWMGFMGLWKGKWYVASTRESHAMSGKKIWSYLREKTGEPPEHWDLMDETAKFTVKLDGQERDEKKITGAVETLKGLGVPGDRIRVDKHFFDWKVF